MAMNPAFLAAIERRNKKGKGKPNPFAKKGAPQGKGDGEGPVDVNKTDLVNNDDAKPGLPQFLKGKK